MTDILKKWESGEDVRCYGKMEFVAGILSYRQIIAYGVCFRI